MSADKRKILAVATKGPGTNEEQRLLDLLSHFAVEKFSFDRYAKLRSGWGLFRQIMRDAPELVALEGTSISAGAACIAGRLLGGVPYIVGSGDAVGPWVGAQIALLGPVFGLYERILCRFCSGFIGWTPYLAGRAMTFGAPKAMTAAGWSDVLLDPAIRAAKRAALRDSLGIRENDVVFGIIGSLHWSRRRKYCYGLELVQAIAQVQRDDICVLIVGDGSGMAQLRALAARHPKRRIILAGAVPRHEVGAYLAAIDIGSLPQSVDGVGNFRYTTKISEYAAAGLKVITLQIPMAYDLSGEWLMRLPGKAPWDRRFIDALAEVMRTISPLDLEATRRDAANLPEFDKNRQVARATEFINDLLEARRNLRRLK